MSGTICAVCVAAAKGTPKRAVDEGRLVAGHGLEGDAHAGSWHRQLSLLAEEEIAGMRRPGLELPPGAFGENLVTAGFTLETLALGRRFRVGETAVLQVTQHGKECHTRCRIYHTVGDCIMPRLGVFARVRRGGVVRRGDAVALDPALDQLRWAVLTLSDRGATGERADDTAGAAVVELVERALIGRLVARALLPDERPRIAAELARLCDEEVCDLVVTTGGTGLAPRDVTPEATREVIDREVPGIAEAIRAAGLAHTPRAMLSRGVCGLRGQALILNLSGSPRAVREQLAVVLPALAHALQVASGIPQDCGRDPR